MGDEETESKCLGFFGELFGHNFKARYSTTSEPPDTATLEISGPRLAETLTALTVKKRTYEKDICARCGKSILKEG